MKLMMETCIDADPDLLHVLLGFGVLIFFYILLLLEVMHRTPIALLTAAIVLVLNTIMRFTSFQDLLAGVDLDTILLLMNMMIIVGVLSKTGFFHYVASKILMKFYKNPFILVIILSAFTAAISAFIDNVTTVLLITPIVLAIFAELGIDPRPVLLAIIFSSNIGGTATLIGDPPNIIIGSVAKLGFMAFIYNLTPIVIIDFLAFLPLFKLLNRNWFKTYRNFIKKKKKQDISLHSKVDEALLKRTMFILFLVIALFFLEDVLKYPPAIPAMIGAGLLILLARRFIDYEEMLHFIDWSTLVFFMAMFIVMRGIERLGVIAFIANSIVSLSQEPIVLLIIVTWISAILSAFIDNIPFVMAMIPAIPIIASASNIDPTPLYWALSLGACLGGNGTIIGASANIVVTGISEKHGYHISFNYFLKQGMFIVLLTVGLSTIYLVARYGIP